MQQQFLGGCSTKNILPRGSWYWQAQFWNLPSSLLASRQAPTTSQSAPVPGLSGAWSHPPPTSRLTPVPSNLGSLSQLPWNPAPLTSGPTPAVGLPEPVVSHVRNQPLPGAGRHQFQEPQPHNHLFQNPAQPTSGPALVWNPLGLQGQQPHYLDIPNSSQQPPHNAKLVNQLDLGQCHH